MFYYMFCMCLCATKKPAKPTKDTEPKETPKGEGEAEDFDNIADANNKTDDNQVDVKADSVH